MSIKPIRTIFMGTPDFAVPSLGALINDEEFNVIAVVTQPDKKIGRKQILTPTPVKKKAQEKDIPVWQPDRINEIEEELRKYQPDIIVVVAYAQKIPPEILNIPEYGIFNVHGSLLPEYRGASCLQAPILNGDKRTGVTIMKMDAGLDTGNILIQKEIEITSSDTTPIVHDKLAELGADILPDSLKDYIQGKIESTPQDDLSANYVPALKKEDGKINWHDPAEKIERMIRALNPWPGTYSHLSYSGEKKIMLKILEASSEALNINEYPAGTLFMDRQEKLGVQCGQNALKIEKIQPEGKKPMPGKDFIKGYKDLLGKPLE
jgi:methionyl-tRNA formyltransferase